MIRRLLNNPFARNSLIIFIGSMIGNVLGYFFHFAIGRMVSIQTYGEVESLTSFVNMVSVPSLAITMIATRYAASHKAENDPKASQELFSYLNKKIAKYTIPLFLILVIFSPYLGKFLQIDNHAALVLIWLTMLFSFFSAVAGGIVSGWQRFMGSNWAGIWGSVVKLALGIILVKIGWGLGGIIGSYVLAAATTYFYLVYVLKKLSSQKSSQHQHLREINFSSIKKELIPVFVGNLAINVMSNVDMFIAKHNLSPDLAGQYGALTITSKIIFFATGAIATVLFSMAAEDNHKKNNPLKMFKYALLILSLIALGSTLVYFVVPKLILWLLFGSKYQGAAGYLGWFAISVSIFSLSNLVFQYLLSIGKDKSAWGFLLIAIISSLAILFFGSNISAIIGITIVAQLVAFGFGLIYLLNSQKYE